MINQKPSLVNPTLSESESYESILDQPLVEKMVDLAPPSVNRNFPIESESSVLNKLEVNPPIPEVHERNSLVPIEKEDSSHVPMTHPLSSLVTSFHWSGLVKYCLPSYVPFQITIHAYSMVIPSTVIDEGTFVSILSSTS